MNFQKLIYNAEENDFQEFLKKHNVSQKMMEDGIEHIVSWFNMQPHYPNFTKEDPRLKRFLAANNFSIEETKRVLENLLTARSLIPEYFVVNEAKIKSFFGSLECAIIPKITPNYERVLIYRVKPDDITLFGPCDYYSYSIIVENLNRHFECTMDFVFIYDFSNFTLSHGIKVTPTNIKNLTQISKNCYGGKMKAMHVLNLPSFTHNFLAIIKSLIGKKLSDRIHLHQGYESLTDIIPKECLPIDYGGTCGTIKEHTDNLRKCLESEEIMKMMMDYSNEKSDEIKRPEVSKVNLDFPTLGEEGSFRTLNVD